jgi:hypothetical protein
MLIPRPRLLEKNESVPCVSKTLLHQPSNIPGNEIGCCRRITVMNNPGNRTSAGHREHLVKVFERSIFIVQKRYGLLDLGRSALPGIGGSILRVWVTVYREIANCCEERIGDRMTDTVGGRKQNDDNSYRQCGVDGEVLHALEP